MQIAASVLLKLKQLSTKTVRIFRTLLNCADFPYTELCGFSAHSFNSLVLRSRPTCGMFLAARRGQTYDLALNRRFAPEKQQMPFAWASPLS